MMEGIGLCWQNMLLFTGLNKLPGILLIVAFLAESDSFSSFSVLCLVMLPMLCCVFVNVVCRCCVVDFFTFCVVACPSG